MASSGKTVLLSSHLGGSVTVAPGLIAEVDPKTKVAKREATVPTVSVSVSRQGHGLAGECTAAEARELAAELVAQADAIDAAAHAPVVSPTKPSPAPEADHVPVHEDPVNEERS